MLNGIAAAFCKKASVFGKLNADYACIEVDEANLPLFFQDATPDIIVVTNLFRDQLDRYGEIDITAQILKKAFDMVPDTALILNGDDPVTSALGKSRKNTLYYGSAAHADIISCDEIRDGSSCPLCGNPLTYEYYMYGQIGKYMCSCGYTNPKITYAADHITIKEGILEFDLIHQEKCRRVRSSICSIYHIYNTLAVCAALECANIPLDSILPILQDKKPEPGRMSRFQIGKKCVYLMLSKNPTGFNQSVTTLVNDTRPKNVMIILNDNAQDGEDISWIWDVDFETMLQGNAINYTLCGQRRYDMYLRLKYAGYDESLISVFDTQKEGIEHMLSYEGIGYVLGNYTAMYPAYRALLQLEERNHES